MAGKQRINTTISDSKDVLIAEITLPQPNPNPGDEATFILARYLYASLPPPNNPPEPPLPLILPIYIAANALSALPLPPKDRLDPRASTLLTAQAGRNRRCARSTL